MSGQQTNKKIGTREILKTYKILPVFEYKEVNCRLVFKPLQNLSFFFVAYSVVNTVV
jgi:hypothetical protein